MTKGLVPAVPQPIKILAQEAISPIDDVFGALGREMDEVAPDVPTKVCLYIKILG